VFVLDGDDTLLEYIKEICVKYDHSHITGNCTRSITRWATYQDAIITT
jgi:hypothetical protein